MAGNDTLILPATVSFAVLAMTCLHTLTSSSLSFPPSLRKNQKPPTSIFLVVFIDVIQPVIFLAYLSPHFSSLGSQAETAPSTSSLGA